MTGMSALDRASSTSIRPAVPDDARAICGIYNGYVLGTTITFEARVVPVPEMAARITTVSGRYPWLVADSEAGVLAYAYASEWRARAAYGHAAESTIYVREDATGSGIGYPLYLELLERLRGLDFHAVVGCIALPNPGSVAFHERCGFRKVGHFPEVGRKFERWVDVGFWQRLL